MNNTNAKRTCLCNEGIPGYGVFCFRKENVLHCTKCTKQRNSRLIKTSFLSIAESFHRKHTLNWVTQHVEHINGMNWFTKSKKLRLLLTPQWTPPIPSSCHMHYLCSENVLILLRYYSKFNCPIILQGSEKFSWIIISCCHPNVFLMSSRSENPSRRMVI